MRELKFDANLGFQQEAIQAITDIFKGQKVCQSNFTVRKMDVEENLRLDVQGYSNRLELLPEEICPLKAMINHETHKTHEKLSRKEPRMDTKEHESHLIYLPKRQINDIKFSCVSCVSW